MLTRVAKPTATLGARGVDKSGLSATDRGQGPRIALGLRPAYEDERARGGRSQARELALVGAEEVLYELQEPLVPPDHGGLAENEGEVMSDNYFCRSATTTSAGWSAVRTARRGIEAKAPT